MNLSEKIEQEEPSRRLETVRNKKSTEIYQKFSNKIQGGRAVHLPDWRHFHVAAFKCL